MKKLCTIIATGLLLAGGLFSSGCKTNEDSGTAETMREDRKYTCMHHPEIVQSNQGSCPKCQMTLIPK